MTSAGPQPEKRCTRADREAVADRLGQHFAAGSLDDEEFSTRLDKAMAAKFPSELASLCTDLPDLPPADEPDLPQPGPFGYAPKDRYVVVDGQRIDLRYTDPSALAGKTVRREPYAHWRLPGTWTQQNWLAVGAAFGAMAISRASGGHLIVAMLICCLVNGALGSRKSRRLAVIGAFSGFLVILGTVLMIVLTWRRKAQQ